MPRDRWQESEARAAARHGLFFPFMVVVTADAAGAAGGIRVVSPSPAAELERETLGFVAHVAGQPVAAAEYVPATLAPFPLPGKGSGDAVLTCVHSTSTGGPDYRWAVLERLMAHLGARG